MSVYVFAGPTISPAEASCELEAVYLPPAAEGDVYRATLRRPQAIGIIDGYFQSVPTVRHKEILWAMSRGIHVFGSASIGALRAAELAAFGMEGVGAIFESYRDGILEDDDEVAIAHGPSEVGFLAGSEAMVNIRQTLLKAERVGIVSSKLRRALERIAKELFYPHRNYCVLLRSASECGLPEKDLARFREWLPEGKVNQKREDALSMLRLIRHRLVKGLESKTVAYSFEQTSMWEAAWRQSLELRFDSSSEPGVVAIESVLDELRLEDDRYKKHSLLALERFFAIGEADRLGMSVSDERRKKTEILFRQEHGLVDAAKVRQWMSDNDLSDRQFDTLMMNEARVRWVRQRARDASVNSLLEQLRLSGDYPRLVARAAVKNRLLESLGLKNPSLENANLTENQLLRWYFGEFLGRPMTDDPNSYAGSLGFANRDAFRRALLREYLYRRFEHRTKHIIEGPN